MHWAAGCEAASDSRSELASLCGRVPVPRNAERVHGKQGSLGRLGGDTSPQGEVLRDAYCSSAVLPGSDKTMYVNLAG